MCSEVDVFIFSLGVKHKFLVLCECLKIDPSFFKIYLFIFSGFFFHLFLLAGG